MAVIQNKWIEKQRKKKKHETAPAYAKNHLAETEIFNAEKPVKRFTVAARTGFIKTLRGVRK